jgi:hypothetical protein
VPRQTTVVSVFLASPSDVAAEREIVIRSVTQWNAIRGKDRNLIFEIIRWETNTSPAIGIDAQDVINEQIDDDYDVMISIFWTRLGTETARAASGSVEEYERALDRHRAGESIQIGIYFKMTAPTLEGFSPQQYQGVLDLKDRLKSDGVYYKEFSDQQSLDFEIDILLDRLARTFGTGPVDETAPAGPDGLGIDRADSDSGADEPVNERAGIGYLDVLESMEEHSNAASLFLDGSTKYLEQINSITEDSTRRMTELKALGPVQPADVRPIINSMTEGYDQYSSFIESGLEEFTIHNSGMAEDTRDLIEVSGDFDSSPEDISQARRNFQGYIDSMSEAIESMEGFVESIRSLQRMTVKFNHSRRRLISNLEKLIELMRYSKSIVVEAVATLSV